MLSRGSTRVHCRSVVVDDDPVSWPNRTHQSRYAVRGRNTTVVPFVPDINTFGLHHLWPQLVNYNGLPEMKVQLTSFKGAEVTDGRPGRDPSSGWDSVPVSEASQ
jgi:hypothetical protein